MDTPGNRLKKLRKNMKLTQGQLGEKIGVKWYQIKDMELGIVKITPKIAKLLYHALSVNPDYLFEGKGEMFIEKPSEKHDLVVQEMLLLLEDMEDDERKDILKIIKEKILIKELLKEKSAQASKKIIKGKRRAVQ